MRLFAIAWLSFVSRLRSRCVPGMGCPGHSVTVVAFSCVQLHVRSFMWVFYANFTRSSCGHASVARKEALDRDSVAGAGRAGTQSPLVWVSRDSERQAGEGSCQRAAQQPWHGSGPVNPLGSESPS